MVSSVCLSTAVMTSTCSNSCAFVLFTVLATTAAVRRATTTAQRRYSASPAGACSMCLFTCFLCRINTTSVVCLCRSSHGSLALTIDNDQALFVRPRPSQLKSCRYRPIVALDFDWLVVNCTQYDVSLGYLRCLVDDCTAITVQ